MIMLIVVREVDGIIRSGSSQHDLAISSYLCIVGKKYIYQAVMHA